MRRWSASSAPDAKAFAHRLPGFHIMDLTVVGSLSPGLQHPPQEPELLLHHLCPACTGEGFDVLQ